MTRFEEILATTKLNELVAKKDDDAQMKKMLLWGLAIVGAIAAIAGIAYAVYRFFAPDYLEDFEDEDFEDELDADFFNEEDVVQ